MDGVCVDGRVLHARHLVCVCASRDYSLTWDEGADGLEIAQSGREKRVVGKAMMEWSRAGWMDGRRDCQMQGSCMYSPSFYVRLFSPIALICLSCLLLLYRPSAAAVAGPGVLLTPCVPIVSLTRGQ